MTAESTISTRFSCPSCGQKAKRVGTATMRALLKDEFAQFFTASDVSCCDSNGAGCQPIQGDTGWRFCESKNCDVVYFSEESDTMFTKSQLKVEVGVKETIGDRRLCYCFGHSMASIKEELRMKGRSDALEDIRAKMKDPGCRCETENPAGSCCLGSVTRGIKIAREEIGLNEPDTQLPASAASSSNRGELIAKVGTVLSAIMASACCWLPLVLLAVGVSGAGIASTLEAYRPYFMVVTFGFLGAAFYYTYRPKKAVMGGGHARCGSAATDVEDCCASPAKGRFNMMTLNKAMLWIVTVMAVAFLLFPNYVGAFLGGDGKTVTDNMNRAEFKVEGMTCEGCALIAERAIRAVPGVEVVEVDYQNALAVVGTEICCPVPKDKILVALKSAGYSGKLIGNSEPQAASSRTTGKTERTE